MYIYKNKLNVPIQRNSQSISKALQNIASTSQDSNQKVIDVVNASPAVGSENAASSTQVRVRPPKIVSSSQPITSTENLTVDTK